MEFEASNPTVLLDGFSSLEAGHSYEINWIKFKLKFEQALKSLHVSQKLLFALLFKELIKLGVLLDRHTYVDTCRNPYNI